MSSFPSATLRKRIAALWQNTRLLFGVLGLVRFQLIFLLIGLGLVLFVGQAKDLLIYYGLKCQSDFGAEIVLFLATAMGCALTVWYSARVMFRFRFVTPDQRLATEPRISPSDQDVFPWLKHHLPRWLGASVYLILLLGLARLWDGERFHPLTLVILLLVSLVIFVLFVNLRRRVFHLPRYKEQKSHNNLDDFADLPVSTRRWYWVLLASNALVMIAAVRAPHAMASLIGPGGVLLLGAALAVVVGSTLVYLSNWFRFPVVWVTLALIAVFSLFNENHRIRLCPEMSSTDRPDACVAQTDTRPTPEQALEDWVIARKKEQDTSLPVFIVAAEGGGMRAAYWTASVLSTLEDQSAAEDPFHRYTLGMSGVSGGSLGVSVFAALVADGRRPMRTHSSEVLQEDVLGPTLVTLMFPDLLQRFLPVPIFDDRAMTLEQAFENAWSLNMGSDRFAQPLAALAATDAPMLFLNATVVETGERLVYAPVTMGDTFAAVDGRAALGHQVPLSTAVHNSARFPYVSPAGVVRRRDNDTDDARSHWLRLVDGGYVDNAGSTTALELLELVLRERDGLRKRHGVTLEPFVIQITNFAADPVSHCHRERASDAAREKTSDCFKRRFLPETLSPLISILNTRPANTRADMARLLETAGAGRYIQLPLRDNGVVHPLGWMLAQPSMLDMARQIEGYGSTSDNNETGRARDDVRDELATVLRFLNDTLGVEETP